MRDRYFMFKDMILKDKDKILGPIKFYKHTHKIIELIEV